MTLLEQIAQQRTNDVVYNALSVTIERVAAELSRELLDDPGVRAELKAAVVQSFGRTVRDLRKNGQRRVRKGGAR